MRENVGCGNQSFNKIGQNGKDVAAIRRRMLVKGARGKNSGERASYLALFSFSTREMKIKERAS